MDMLIFRSIDCTVLKCCYKFTKCLKTDQKDKDLRKIKVKPVTPKLQTFGRFLCKF